MKIFYHSLSCVCMGCIREDAITIGCGDSGMVRIVFVPKYVRTGQ